MSRKEAIRILLVDDDKDLLDLLKYNFEKEGFRVKTVSKVIRVIAAAEEFQPELIVLDLVMPDGNGIELCKQIRRLRGFENTYIFFLSARAEKSCSREALDTGADDFIEKLSGIRALTNKVKAVLTNKFVIKKRIERLSSADLVVNKRAEIVYLSDRELVLSSPEFEILFFLMQNPKRIVSRKNLIRIIWGSEIFVLDSSVQNYVENLQRKIGTRFIETVGKGQYRFNQPVN